MTNCKICHKRIWFWQTVGTFNDNEHESCREKEVWNRWPHSDSFKEWHLRHFGKES